jgi:predicted aminopeptidase
VFTDMSLLMRRSRLLASIALIGTALAIGACSSGLGYYGQSISGQLEVLNRRQPISGLLQDDATPTTLKVKLQHALEMRRFASEVLGLPDNGSYLSYADLKRPYVIWNVFAAPELSTELERWCFPFAGCVQYRGYFSESDAEAFAQRLHAKGYDTHVGGVSAYSTLGWFDDPLLNTVIRRSDARLAGLIFHELAHQQLYVKGDTAFNEGFATTIELEGVRRWLEHAGQEAEALEYLASRQRRQDFTDLVMKTRDKLQQLYDTDLDVATKRARKHAILESMRGEYLSLKQKWGGHSGYDRWFDGELNNAKLGAVSAYHDYVPLFQALLARNGGDLRAFYAAVKQIADTPAEERLTRLRQAAGGGAFTASDHGGPVKDRSLP